MVSSIYHCSICFCCQIVIIKYQHKHTSQHKKVTHARILTIVLPMDQSWHMTCCSAISLGFSDAGKYPQILNLISHPLSFDIEPLLEIICPSSNKACTLYTINFNSFSKSHSEEVVLTMKVIEDLCKSQNDVASYRSYPL